MLEIGVCIGRLLATMDKLGQTGQRQKEWGGVEAWPDHKHKHTPPAAHPGPELSYFGTPTWLPPRSDKQCPIRSWSIQGSCVCLEWSQERARMFGVCEQQLVLVE